MYLFRPAWGKLPEYKALRAVRRTRSQLKLARIASCSSLDVRGKYYFVDESVRKAAMSKITKQKVLFRLMQTNDDYDCRMFAFREIGERHIKIDDAVLSELASYIMKHTEGKIEVTRIFEILDAVEGEDYSTKILCDFIRDIYKYDDNAPTLWGPASRVDDHIFLLTLLDRITRLHNLMQLQEAAGKKSKYDKLDYPNTLNRVKAKISSFHLLAEITGEKPESAISITDMLKRMMADDRMLHDWLAKDSDMAITLFGGSELIEACFRLDENKDLLLSRLRNIGDLGLSCRVAKREGFDEIAEQIASLWKDVPGLQKKKKIESLLGKIQADPDLARLFWIILQKINEENVVIVPETWFEGMCSDSFMSDDYRVSFPPYPFRA